MTKEKAIQILKDFNKYRRAEGKYELAGIFPEYSPTIIGQAIDFAIENLDCNK